MRRILRVVRWLLLIGVVLFAIAAVHPAGEDKSGDRSIVGA